MYRKAYIEEFARKRLTEGEKYVFRMMQKEPYKVVKVENMYLVKKYPHIAEFEDARGIKRSFDYLDCVRMLRGESVEC